VIKDLLSEGHAFSFFQVMRILRLSGRVFGHRTEDGSRQTEPTSSIRIRPDLSLAFPPSDVVKVEVTGSDEFLYRVTVAFLGLYGTSSPLPTFYSEDLIEEARRDSSVSRDFLDTLNQRTFELVFQCWLKYRLFMKVVEEQDPDDIERMFCLMGLHGLKLDDGVIPSYSLLRYIGLFTQFPRSLFGLETLLHDALGGIPVSIEPCTEATIPIPPDQRFSLGISGNILGESSFLGSLITDRMGAFRIGVGPVNSEQFHSFLQGNRDQSRLSYLTQLYLTDSLDYCIELTLAAGEAETARPGEERWSRLGLDTWLLPGEHDLEVQAVFAPH